MGISRSIVNCVCVTVFCVNRYLEKVKLNSVLVLSLSLFIFVFFSFVEARGFPTKENILKLALFLCISGTQCHPHIITSVC